MLKIMVSVMVIAVLGFGDAPVLKTGQTTVYKVNDDGTYQSGIARSYARDDVNGTVTDNATNLEWQDDTVGAMTWSNAITHCEDLSLDGKIDWRLPSQKELRTLVNTSNYNPAIDSIFQNMTSSYYWSSTTVINDASAVWDIYFVSGRDSKSPKNHTGYVRCVRNEG